MMRFSCGWGERGEEGSSEDPGNIFYRGPEPFSEPETNAIKVSRQISMPLYDIFTKSNSWNFNYNKDYFGNVSTILFYVP